MSKTIIVTGTSSGFGRLIVETVATAGHTVFATMRDVDGKNAGVANDIRAWAATNDKHVTVVDLDVSSSASVARAAKEILGGEGAVDVVVNNAGITAMGVAEASTPEDFQRVFDVNVLGVVRVTNAFLPAMRERGDGLIVTISSIMGRVTLPFAGAYTASKWAVEGLAETYRYELAPLGIDSVIVEPGAFPTDIMSNALHPSNPDVAEQYGALARHMNRFGQAFTEMLSGDNIPDPQDVADATLNLIDTPRGQRPLRAVVDRLMGDGARAINAAAAGAQRDLLTRMGLEDLEQPRE